jgi:hypothetical protein
MSGWHPKHAELARLSGEGRGDAILGHVCSCDSCGRVVADHGWLQDRLAGTLEGIASEIPVPQSAWREVRDTVQESKRRQLVRIQLSAVVSAAMVVCLLLCVPGFMRPAATAPVLRPEVALRPTPTVVTEATGACNGSLTSGRLEVLTVSRLDAQPSPAPALAPLPMPLDSGP